MRANCVYLKLWNPHLESMLRTAVIGNLQVIDTDYCTQEGYDLFYENEQHVTLYYGLDIGFNRAYYEIKIAGRELYKELCNTKVLQIPEVKINTFDGDRIVVKIDLTEIPLFNVLNQYHERLKPFSNGEHDFPTYNPHITLTYLKKDASESEIHNFINYFNKDLLHEFKMESICISESRDLGGHKEFIDLG